MVGIIEGGEAFWTGDIAGVAVAGTVFFPSTRTLGRGGGRGRGKTLPAFFDGEMAFTEFLCGGDEPDRFKVLTIPRRGRIDISSAPAAIHQMPLPLILPESIPSMASRGPRECLTGGISKPLPMSCDNYSLYPTGSGEGFEEFGVALADGEAGAEDGGGGLWADVASEEGGRVVGDVEVQPREDGACPVCRRGRERCRQGAAEPVYRRDVLAREFGAARVGVGAGVVAAVPAAAHTFCHWGCYH